MRKRFISFKDGFSPGIDIQFRNDVYRFAQKQHLTSSLFSLDEIVITPRVLTPLIQMPRSVDQAPTDCVSLSVPYLPDWPEVGVIYKVSTLPLVDALQGGANVILAGHPGSGKTVALAWLASAIALRAQNLGKLADLTPLYIHASDLTHLLDGNESKSPESKPSLIDHSNGSLNTSFVKSAEAATVLIIDAISKYISPANLSQLPKFIRSSLENQRAFLILDRVDELPPFQAARVTEILKLLLEKYPKLRVITALSYEFLAGLPLLGFNLLAMAGWGEVEQQDYVQRWDQQWMRYIHPGEKPHSKEFNPYYLKSWLAKSNDLFKPLEFALKVWAAYSGDILAPDGPGVIEAYIRRMLASNPDAQPALEQFALQLLYEQEIKADPATSAEFISFYKNANALPETGMDFSEKDTEHAKPISRHLYRQIPGVELLIENGFLISYPGGQVGFSHPVISGYLAGKALSDSKIIVHFQDQPSWSGKELAFYYFSRLGDATPLIQYYLQEDDLLHTNLIKMSRWLQVSSPMRPWRSNILRSLSITLQKEKEALNLAGKIMAGLALSGDSGAALYFRQLLKSGSPNLKQLAALGSGIVRDKKSTEDLLTMLQEQSPTSIRAASLGLAAIGDKHSLEILAANLLNGSELSRRYAAEALANNPNAGYPTLQDGSTMEDLLVRRSVAFGLIRVDQPWARKIVENYQLEDKEWVVRNAAIQAFDELRRRSSFAPQPPYDPIDLTWLNEYAVKIGTTVAPGQPGEALIIKALSSGSSDEKMNAMEFFRTYCDPEILSLVKTVYLNNTGELRETAYYLLWLMTTAGIKLPVTFE